MNITFAPKGILQIDEARIVYRNFEGAGSKYNREGDRNFSVVIPDRELTNEEVKSFMDIYTDARLVEDEDGVVLVYNDAKLITLADALQSLNWNVRIKPPRDADDTLFMHLPVKVKFNDRGPRVYLKAGDNMTELDASTVKCLDRVDILNVDMDIRPYDYDVDELGRGTGRTAYLQSICVTQEFDRFADRYR